MFPVVVLGSSACAAVAGYPGSAALHTQGT